MYDRDDENDKERDLPLETDLGHGNIDGLLEVFRNGDASVTITYCPKPQPWWRRWRSDLPFPGGDQKAITQIVRYALIYMPRKKREHLPSFVELKLYW